MQSEDRKGWLAREQLSGKELEVSPSQLQPPRHSIWLAFLSPGPTSVGHRVCNPVPLPLASLSPHFLQAWLVLTKRKCVWFCLVSFPVNVTFQREIIVRNIAVS